MTVDEETQVITLTVVTIYDAGSDPLVIPATGAEALSITGVLPTD